jgi:hypothetical protein
MEISKGQELKNKIDELKSETGLSDAEIKKLFIKEYLLGEEEESADEKFSNWLRRAIGK